MFEFAVERADVCAEARSWIGTKFQNGACVKGVAVDCGRFIAAVFRNAGFHAPDVAKLPHFPRGWFLHRNGEDYLPIMQNFTVAVERPLPGDIVMYKIGRQWAHAGIILDWPLIVHAVDPIVQYARDNEILHVGKERLFLSAFK